ncbi:uncharacterized protein TRUGW13939_03859 [Talaromyces rugulosus]|uniref:Nephrocystin 3-like N-terminal domain-containing protein n=1 Tax=Talaromyces rugulosus TaxID=121627 RepID=A0A7H8QS45_TALRU|nr:uncharacterized protein TRUGW13939_03859 [Talaromyces rugulosus]QKX56752.1 hypothetical protein TRUGW13939_03859 [Talaromyces rugulosus]
MSGAEALAVFGIVCNVMQVIGFVKDGAHMAKAIYKTGTLDPSLAQTIGYIKGGLERLKDSLEKGRPLIQDEEELLDIANGSLETAEELKAELKKIAGTLAKGKYPAAFRGWFKAALGGKRRIERLEKVMHNRQQILENRLIVRICNKNDALLLEQHANFDKLDRALQGFVECCARNQTTLDQLIQRGFLTVTTHIGSKMEALAQSVEVSISSGTNQLQDNISSRLQELAYNRIEKEEHDRLLGSLKHETMNVRRNHIIVNHDDTFSWIFHPQHGNSDAGNQDGFVDWLKSSKQRPYWVSGKAGSGKSVLMKFLVNNPRTQSILDDAHGTTIVLSHFLWAAGQSLERNMQGLLCSLTHQLLATKPDLCRVVLEKVPASRQKRFPGDWSTNELRALSVDVIPACGQHVCIFLDGLDETDDYMALVDFLGHLCALPRLQVCVSSRPEPTLQRRFHSCPQLRVQDLTRLDIEKYAHDTLRRLPFDDPETTNRLVSIILSKADGVFLWVALALKSVQTGYDNHDDPAELQARLESLPNDLNTLYQRMWRRLNDSEAVYRGTAALYFNLMLECVGNIDLTSAASPLLLALALHPPLAATVVTEDIEFWEGQLHRECERITERLPIRCAGLLEVTADGTVALIHRSAQEFLTNTPEGQRIRGADSTPRETHRLNLIRGLLGCYKLEIEAEAQTLSPRILNLCQPLGRKLRSASSFFELCRYDLSPESVHTLFNLAQALYSTRKWVFDYSFYLQPDFLGAIARAGFFALTRDGFAQLAGAAPRGWRISRLYQAYILECVLDSVKWSEVKTSAQDLAFLCALGNTSSTQNARYSIINFIQSIVGTVGEEDPPFYITSDPLQLLMEESLLDEFPGRYNSLDLMISLLEGGCNLSTRDVILLHASAPDVSDIFQYQFFSYPKFLPGGTLFIEVNTSFLLTLFVRLLASQQSLFPFIVDFPALFQRLETAVGGLTTPAFSQLRGFVPEYTRAAVMHPETRPAEEDSQDVYGGHGDSEGEQSDEEEFGSEEDLDGDNDDSNDSERRTWASSTEVLIPCNDDDSNAVLAGLFGDIFTSITRGKNGCLLGKLEIPGLESRLQQILPNARRSTVQELEEALIQDGFLVPCSAGPDVWPPRVYSPDPACDEVEA